MNVRVSVTLICSCLSDETSDRVGRHAQKLFTKLFELKHAAYVVRFSLSRKKNV